MKWQEAEDAKGDLKTDRLCGLLDVVQKSNPVYNG
jgi:hypothetical protein